MNTQELRNKIDGILGNSIRVLLPSYWWKKLFHHVADRIDEAEQFASELVEASKMPIVESIDELNRLKVDDGNLASVLGYETKERSFRELYQTSILDITNENFSKCTEVEDIIVKAPNIGSEEVQLVFATTDLSRKLMILASANTVVASTGSNVITLYDSGEYIQEGHDRLQEELSSYKYVFVYSITDSSSELNTSANYDIIDTFLTCVATLPTANVYVKGNTWEQLAKKGDVGEYTGSSGLPIYIALGNALLTAEQKNSNKETLANIHNGTPYAIFIYDEDGQSVSFNSPIAMYYEGMKDSMNGLYFFTHDWDDGTTNLLGFYLNSDGIVTKDNDKLPDTVMSDTSTNPVQNKVIKAYVDDNLNDLTEEIITNEEVHAAALNDLNARIKELEERLKNAGL